MTTRDDIKQQLTVMLKRKRELDEQCFVTNNLTGYTGWTIDALDLLLLAELLRQINDEP